jgi:cellulose biosynthesis protein BcsQ
MRLEPVGTFMRLDALMATAAIVFPLLAPPVPVPSHDTNPPTWTSGEVLSVILTVVIGALVPVITGLAWLFRYLYHRDAQYWKSRVEHAEWEKGQLDQKAESVSRELTQLKDERLPRKAEFDQVKTRLDKVTAFAQQLYAAYSKNNDEAATKEQLLQNMQKSLGQLKVELSDYDRKLRATASRVRRALKLEGLIWEEKVPSNAPRFRAPQLRKAPFVSVLNLKGGVGKTTITANLGASLAHLGYRVLLVDLDLQGSLTSLFLPDEEQLRLYQRGNLLQNYFDRAAEDVRVKLLDYSQPILGGKSGLVATADTLAYTELNLTFKWLLRIGKRDPRFLLRKAMHLRMVSRKYDVVLLDCPPLMNVSCVNALAASDYVLIPVMPSKQATGRVPALLRTLRSFRENLNQDLKILGVLANRTHGSKLTADEANRWTELRDQCRDQWGEAVAMLETFIRQSTEIRVMEDAHRPVRIGDEMFQPFLDLAREVERRLPSFCLPKGRRAVQEEAAP